MKLLRIKLPDSLHARLRRMCEMQEPRVSMQALSAQLLGEWTESKSREWQAQANPRPSVQNERAR